jgi:hypothetical protein
VFSRPRLGDEVFWFFFSKKNSLFLARGRPTSPARKQALLFVPWPGAKEAKTFIPIHVEP